MVSYVSIHAPVKGATTATPGTATPGTGFNPRTREGCDYRRHLRAHLYVSFNPRTREGCDLASIIRVSATLGFNPRTREGCDCPHCGARVVSIYVSIHAPVKGATSSTLLTTSSTVEFQSTHP